MTCKGICVRYKAQKPVGTGRYASGQRRCQICEIFIKWEGLWCPCCGYKLRTQPLNLKYKAKLRARVEVDSIEAQAATEIESEVPEITIKAKTKSKAKTSIPIKNIENPDFVMIKHNQMVVDTNKMQQGFFYFVKYGGNNYAIKKNSQGSLEFADIAKADYTRMGKNRPKTTKNTEKTPCKYCEKLFVYPDKHEKNCKKNTEVVSSQTSESIAIKA